MPLGPNVIGHSRDRTIQYHWEQNWTLYHLGSVTYSSGLDRYQWFFLGSR